jgi:endonuclease III
MSYVNKKALFEMYKEFNSLLEYEIKKLQKIINEKGMINSRIELVELEKLELIQKAVRRIDSKLFD